MESEKDVILEMDPITIPEIIANCIKSIPWCVEHEDEIRSLIKRGWTSAQKIVNYLKKKYHKK